jgi:hypothetical protein
MSSHREAPSISKDPVADNTDTYAFVSPGGTVTLITNYLPAQTPAGGPNFYEFGDDVLYEINVDNDGDGQPNVTYQLQFTTEVTNPDTFLYNTGPIDSLDSPSWNRRQTYTLTKVVRKKRRKTTSTVLASGLVVPPCNIGPRSTPDYGALADAATYSLPTGERVFAGQRADAFFVDLGSIFDLGALRPIEFLHVIPTAAASGVDTLANANVHTIAIQVPIADLTSDRVVPTDPESPASVIGVWGAASRQTGKVHGKDGKHDAVGPWVQVSRLGNPLFNEVVVPMAEKDRWNGLSPSEDSGFAQYVAQPELARLLPVLYPDKFPNLASLTTDRADLLAILLTGIPKGIIPGFSTFTGATQADELRVNLAIAPAANPDRLGVLGGDLAGFPNGRRLTDDVVTIELRAVAGATVPLVQPYTPDDAVAAVEDGTFNNPGRVLLDDFPYMGLPYSGYAVPAG